MYDHSGLDTSPSDKQSQQWKENQSLSVSTVTLEIDSPPQNG